MNTVYAEANLHFFVFVQELIKDLQTAKRQTWEERERLSEHYDEERRITLANKVSPTLYRTVEVF